MIIKLKGRYNYRTKRVYNKHIVYIDQKKPFFSPPPTIPN